MMNSFYSSWPVSTVGGGADKTNKKKISQDKQFQRCGSNSEHARDLMASSVTVLLPAHRKKFGKPIYAHMLLVLTLPALSDRPIPQFNQMDQNRQLWFHFPSGNDEPQSL